jgi:hypothetical protein
MDYGKDKGMVKQISDFLFARPAKNANGEDSKFLDTKTHVFSKEFMNSIIYYRTLSEQYDCSAAGSIADLLERLAISYQRQGRLEGFGILQGNTPKENTILRGLSEELKKQLEEEGE